jgi:RecA/RadA recombinase
MAKKTKSDEQTTKVLDKIRKEYGDNIVSKANFIFEKPRQLIPISPAFNNVMKGFYEGSFISLSGKSQCGKTSLALDFARKCQLPDYGERDIYYYDVESRLGTRNLHGIDPSKFFIIGSQPGQILTGEQYLQIGYELICDKVGAVHIIDSLGMMGTSKELLANMDENPQLGDINRLINKFIRKIAAPMRVNNSIVIAVNHVYANMGYGGPIKEKISSEVTYLAEYRFLWKNVDPWMTQGAEAKQIGQIMNIDVVKSSTCMPNQKVSSYLRYDPIGIDDVMETMMYAVDIGLIKKGGSWFTMLFENSNLDEAPSVQGQESAYQYLVDNKEKYQLLETKIRELVG